MKGKYRKNSVFRYLGVLISAFLVFQNAVAQQWEHDLKVFREAYIKDINGIFPKIEQDFYELDSSFNAIATYKILKDKKIFEFNTSSNKIKTFKKYAELKIQINGSEVVLYAYQSVPVMKMYKQHIFLPFKDLTTAKLTYGAGRYLDLDIRDFKNGKVIVDFNKTYNPYCAFADGYSCPLPPKENILAVEIAAGEKTPKGH